MNEKRPKKHYIDSLDSTTRQRYDQKIACIGVDPYETKGLSHDLKDLPAITYIDIINYLVNTVNTKSAYTMNELKAFKSLESYNQFVNGWVRDVVSMTVNSNVLVTGKVRHSQRMNDTALKPWLISTPDGIVESAHCNCMAGLGEACSHVGALLFYVESANRITANQTVTQKKAYWLLPTSIDKTPYSEVSDIDFTSADMKRKRMDSAIRGQDTQKKSSSKLPDVAEPTAEEISELNNRLFACNAEASALSVRAAHQESYIPDILREDQLPVTFVSLKEEKYVNMERIELVKHCESVIENISVTEDQARNAEILTRQQSKCRVAQFKNWTNYCFKYEVSLCYKYRQSSNVYCE